MSRIAQDLNGHHSNGNPPSAADAASSTMFRRILPSGRKPHVCIVGAGVAGMRCAQVLGAKGFNVVVLEARNRTGGRMHQSMLGDHPVDHGPNWIHGVNRNPILDLAQEIGATTMTAPESAPSIYDQSGQLLNREECKQSSALMWGIIEEAFDYSNKNSASIPDDQSLLDYFKIRLKGKDVPAPLAERVLLACRSWGDYIGGSIEKQSLKFFWLEETIDGENLFLASTYQSILDRITKDTHTHAKVELSTEVISIESHEPIASDDDNDQPSRISITTSHGDQRSFDEVIMTAPLGWLKHRSSTCFSPPLPSRLLTAIANISYGRLEKVYLTFRTGFWLPPNPPESSGSSSNSTNPFFTQWLAPSYTPYRYPLECVHLSSLPPPHAHPTLLFYTHGPLATHITSLITSISPTSPLYLSLLSDFLRPYYSLLPNYNPSSCQPVAALATDWTHDAFAGWGSYANFQTNSGGHLDADIEALRRGAPGRGVWFAGEHTAPFVGLGTVTGAWWSGERVAGRVVRLYSDRGEEEANGEVEGVGGKRGGTGLGA